MQRARDRPGRLPPFALQQPGPQREGKRLAIGLAGGKGERRVLERPSSAVASARACGRGATGGVRCCRWPARQRAARAARPASRPAGRWRRRGRTPPAPRRSPRRSAGPWPAARCRARPRARSPSGARTAGAGPGASRRSRMARRTCSPIWRCSGVGDAASRTRPKRGGLAEGRGMTGTAWIVRNWLFRLYLNAIMVRRRNRTGVFRHEHRPRPAAESAENTAEAFGVTPVNKVKRVHERGRYDKQDGLRDPRRRPGLPHRLRDRRPALLHADRVLARGRPSLLARLLGQPDDPHAGPGHAGLPHRHASRCAGDGALGLPSFGQLPGGDGVRHGAHHRRRRPRS